MTFEAHRWIQFIFNTLIIVWFFRTVKREKPVSYVRTLLSLGALACTFYLYITVHEFNFPIRFIYRALFYMLYLRLYKGQTLIRCAYYACFAVTCLTACQNIFFTPLLNNLIRGTVNFTGDGFLNVLICTGIQFIIITLILVLVSLFIPFNFIQQPGLPQWGILCAIVICEMYVKQTLNVIRVNNTSMPLEISLFSIFLQLFLLAFLVFFERSLYNSRTGNELRLQEIVNHYRIRNLESKQAGDSDIRRLHHDMKNHMIAIKNMADRNMSADISRYISGLMNELSEYEAHIQTGNDLLNGLIAQKVEEAVTKKIQVEVMLDFRTIDFIEDMDLCTIFGNAIDNAIEACERISDSDKRGISIRSRIAASQLIITFTNSYSGTINLNEGIPESTKTDRIFHGLGIRNIRRVLKKYDGLMNVDLSTPDRFRLSIIIPMQYPSSDI